MTNEELATKITEKISGIGGLENSLKFDFGDDGCLSLSGEAATTEDLDADCTIVITKENFLELLEGKLDPMMAFMGGKIKIEGDMGVAMKLQSIFK